MCVLVIVKQFHLSLGAHVLSNHTQLSKDRVVQLEDETNVPANVRVAEKSEKHGDIECVCTLDDRRLNLQRLVQVHVRVLVDNVATTANVAILSIIW